MPPGTRLLISDEKGIGPKYPFSKEKLTALLGFYVVEDWREACEVCTALLHNGGVGHSLSIHSRDEDVIREFGLRKPVSRMLVNTPSTQGAVGISTGLFPSFTLGCGAVGGSATSDNVTPLNLINVRRVAYDLHTPCDFRGQPACTASSACGVSSVPGAAARPCPPSAALSNCCGHAANHDAVVAPQTPAPAPGGNLDINAITELIVAELKKAL